MRGNMEPEKEKPLYRIILRDAWRTTWEYKQLWFWGLFAGLLGNAGEYQFLLNAFDQATGNKPTLNPLPPLETILVNPLGLGQAILNDPFSLFILLVVGLTIITLVAFFLWLALVSVAALIRAAAQVRQGQITPNFSDGLKRGQTAFGHVLMAVVAGRLINWFLITIVVLLAWLASLDYFFGLPLFLIAFITIVPATFLVSFATRLTVIDTVMGRHSLLEAINQATDLLREHWLIAAELAFILFVINTLAGVAMLATVAITAAPLLIYALFLWQVGYIGLGAFFICLSVAVFLLILLPVGAMLSAFQWSAWTNLYIELKEQSPLGKIARLATRWFGARVATNR
jgi:hypothetical protein